MPPLSASIFPNSPERRVDLARERFFEGGLRPTGLTSEAVIQSWGRCLRRHRDARASVAFEPVSHSRAHLTLQRNRDLISAWSAELPLLHDVLRVSRCSAILTDASGVVIAATPVARAPQQLMPVAHRVGVNLSEAAVGTTAPGLVAKTGRPAQVLGGEHFFDSLRAMYCAAAPIRNAAGHLIGVLDISSEGVPFAFDAAALVGLYAGALENRVLTVHSSGLLVLRLQAHPSLLETPSAGLVAVDESGALVWANRVAAGLLSTSAHDDCDRLRGAEDAFGVRLTDLASLSSEKPRLLLLPNGLSMWVRADSAAWLGERSGASGGPEPSGREPAPILHPATALVAAEPEFADSAPAEAPPTEDAVTLRARDRDLIAHVLDACGGNVSRAAKQLRVSRGLIYRRLRN